MRLTVSNYPGPSALEIEAASFTDRETFDNYIDNICAAADALWGPSFITKEADSGDLRGHTETKRKRVPRPRMPHVQALIDASAELLRGKVHPMPIALIAERMTELGLKINGVNPISNMSATLHHSGLFKCHGKRAGWTLIEPAMAE